MLPDEWSSAHAAGGRDGRQEGGERGYYGVSGSTVVLPRFIASMLAVYSSRREGFILLRRV